MSRPLVESLTVAILARRARLRVGAGSGRSEREPVRLLPRGDPLPGGELVPAGLGPEPAAVARRAHPAERRERVVVEGLVVHVDDPGVELLRQRETTRDRSGL